MKKGSVQFVVEAKRVSIEKIRKNQINIFDAMVSISISIHVPNLIVRHGVRFSGFSGKLEKSRMKYVLTQFEYDNNRRTEPKGLNLNVGRFPK